MTIFRYKADIIPISIFITFFLCDILAYFFIADIMWLLLYSWITPIPRWFICPWNHHHQHVMTFSYPIFNRLIEIMYGFQTGIVWFAWVLHHNLWHHLNYLDQSKDESAWKSSTGKRYNPIIYTWIISITAYPRAWKVGNKYPQMQMYFLLMCLIQLSLLIALIIHNPLAWVLVFLIPMITGIIITAYTTYHHHSGLEGSDHYSASYNLLDSWYNFLTGNLGYHTAHHIKGGLHWSELPRFHSQIESKIGKQFYKQNHFFYYSSSENI